MRRGRSASAWQSLNSRCWPQWPAGGGENNCELPPRGFPLPVFAWNLEIYAATLGEQRRHSQRPREAQRGGGLVGLWGFAL